MENISERLISLEEAKSALRCMRLGGLSEEDAVESLDCVCERVRKVTTAGLVEDIIANKLSSAQRDYIKMYWYEQKNTAQIARECGVSQASVYKTIERANEIIRELMTPVISYQKDLMLTAVEPVELEDTLEMCAARAGFTSSFCEMLRNLRVAQAIKTETLARALKISRKELEDIESGCRVPSAVTVQRYSVIFGLEITMTFTNGRGNYQWKKV